MRDRARAVFTVAAACAVAVAGCAGHAGRTLEIRHALDAGQPRLALELIDDELGVDSPSEVPDDVSGDQALLLLDRSMILQQLGQFERSSRDLQIADKQIEVLDLSRGAADDLGRYMFSDDVGPYRAPAYEKLLINTLNLVNYLARGELAGARVEARRLAVMQKFIDEHESRGASLSGPGGYLAGFTFEKSGSASEAMRFYDEALEYGRYASLEEPVRRLSEDASYRSPRIREILERASIGDGAEGGGENDDRGEILVVVSFGRVPAKYPRRLPIGLALTWAAGGISPHHHSQANALAAQGLVTWVNYPELGRPRGEYDVPVFALDGRAANLEGALAVDREARRTWNEARGTVIGAAIVRTITRAVAGEVTRRAAGGGAAGLLLSLGTQAALTVADTPDTRSWATLPARIAVGRVRVKPGVHVVDLWARGAHVRRRVTIAPGGWAVVSLTELG